MTRATGKQRLGLAKMMEQRGDVDNDKSFIALEYLPRGNLAKWIHKLNKLEYQFYNRQLWMLTDCRRCSASA